MLVGAYDLNIGHFYEIFDAENDQREKVLLTDIKINSTGTYVTLLTFNGFFKTKILESNTIFPIDYMAISEKEMLDMIDVIINRIPMNDGGYLAEITALIQRIIVRFNMARNAIRN